jgi:hypothetical protein
MLCEMHDGIADLGLHQDLLKRAATGNDQQYAGNRFQAGTERFAQLFGAAATQIDQRDRGEEDASKHRNQGIAQKPGDLGAPGSRGKQRLAEGIGQHQDRRHQHR